MEDIFNFIDYRGATPTKIQEGVPLITAKNVKEGYIDNTISEFISFAEYETRKGRGIPKIGDILFTTEAPLGNVALADKVIYSPGQRIITFQEITEESVFNPFYLYIFQSSYFKQELVKSKTGSGVEGIQAARLKDILVPLPPFKEQIKIFNLVIRWNAQHEIIAIEKSSLHKLINTAKSKILELAMQGKLVPQDPADEPAADMLLRINPKAKILTDIPHYPKLPDNWVITAFTDVCESRLGKTLNSERDEGPMSPYLCSLNVKQGYFDLSIIKQTRIQSDEYERYSVINGDLLVCEGGDVGRAAIWQGDRICYQNALHRVRSLGNILQKYLYYSLLYSKNKNIIDDLCSGVTIKHFTTKSMSKLSVSLPPIAEQRRIVDKIEELFSNLDKIEESLN